MMNRITYFALMAMGMIAQASAIRIIGLGYILGDDADEYGCKASTGYTWCNETESCVPINQVCSKFIEFQLNQSLFETF